MTPGYSAASLHRAWERGKIAFYQLFERHPSSMMPDQRSTRPLLQSPRLLLESLCNSSLDLPELLHLEIFPDADENETGD
jgi:hypothetical protein